MPIERITTTTIGGSTVKARGHIRVAQTGKLRLIGFAQGRALAGATLSPEIHIARPATVATRRPAVKKSAAAPVAAASDKDPCAELADDSLEQACRIGRSGK